MHGKFKHTTVYTFRMKLEKTIGLLSWVLPDILVDLQQQECQYRDYKNPVEGPL